MQRRWLTELLALAAIAGLLALFTMPAAAQSDQPTGTYDAALVEASLVSTRRLDFAVPLVYYQAVQDTGVQCIGDCTEQVIWSLPTDSPRDLTYTPRYPKLELIPLDPTIPTVPQMPEAYVPHLAAPAADSLYKFIKYVRYTTGEQIYVAHTWRPYYSADALGAGASQHQSGLSADLYLLSDSGGIRRIDELEGIYDMAARYGWIQAFNFEAPHFFYLDAPAPGLTLALRARGVDPTRNVYHTTNALIATYQTLTGTIPPEIQDQLAAESAP